MKITRDQFISLFLGLNKFTVRMRDIREVEEQAKNVKKIINDLFSLSKEEKGLMDWMFYGYVCEKGFFTINDIEKLADLIFCS